MRTWTWTNRLELLTRPVSRPACPMLAVRASDLTPAEQRRVERARGNIAAGVFDDPVVDDVAVDGVLKDICDNFDQERSNL